MAGEEKQWEKLLRDLVNRLHAAERENLRAVVLYGSAASGEFRPGRSDLNILCLLQKLGAANLSVLRAAFRWWTKKGHPAPLLFTLEELERAADVYAIELLEVKTHRRILYGEDVLESLRVPLDLHRMQVERELRHNLIRLREGYVLVADHRKGTLALMLRSASTFALLFRHSLIALGEEAPSAKRDAVTRLAAVLGFDASSFEILFEIRQGSRPKKQADVPALFGRYLEAATRAVEAMDHRLAELEPLKP
ncbi:MAG: hypothetical protein ACRD2B_03770 [Terriglobia bacterium]